MPGSILSHVFLFTDDTKLNTIFTTLADHTLLQTYLDNLTKGCEVWQLNLNVK